MLIKPLSAMPATGVFPKREDNVTHNYEIMDNKTGLRVTVETTGTADYDIIHAGSDGIWTVYEEQRVQIYGGGRVEILIPATALVMGECFSLLGLPGSLPTDVCYITAVGQDQDLTGLTY